MDRRSGLPLIIELMLQNFELYVRLAEVLNCPFEAKHLDTILVPTRLKKRVEHYLKCVSQRTVSRVK